MLKLPSRYAVPSRSSVPPVGGDRPGSDCPAARRQRGADSAGADCRCAAGWGQHMLSCIQIGQASLRYLSAVSSCRPLTLHLQSRSHGCLPTA